MAFVCAYGHGGVCGRWEVCARGEVCDRGEVYGREVCGRGEVYGRGEVCGVGVCVATGGVCGVGWRGDGGAEEGWVCSVEEPPVVAWLAVAASLFPLASLFLLFLSSLCIGCNLSSVVA